MKPYTLLGVANLAASRRGADNGGVVAHAITSLPKYRYEFALERILRHPLYDQGANILFVECKFDG
jgi:hypothetical protein